MSKRWLLAVAAVSLAAGAVVVWRPKPARRGADLLPDATPVYLTFANVNAARARWAKSPASALSAALVKEQWAGLAGALLRKRWGRLVEVVTEGWPQIAEGEVFVALTGLQTVPRIAPQMAVGIQFGARGAQALDWITHFTGLLQREFPATRSSRERYFGKSYYLWQGEPGLDICVAMLGDRLIITIGTTPMMEIIERYREPERGTLSGSDAFRAVCKRLPANADWLLVVQTGPLLQRLDPFVQWLPQLRLIAQPLARVAGIGAAETLEADRVHDRVVVTHHPASLLPRQPVPATVLGRLPASCMACVLADVSPHEAYEVVAAAIAAADQREWLKAWAVFEAGWRAAKVDLDKDVLAMLKPPLVFAVDWPESQSPHPLIGVASSKAGPLRECLSRAGDPSRLPLRWQMVNDWLWLSGSSESLARAQNAATNAASALAARLRSGTLAHHLPRGGWAWLYADMSRLLQDKRDSVTSAHPLTCTIRRRGSDDVVTAISSAGVWLNAWLALESWMAGMARAPANAEVAPPSATPR
ncbi:MAG: hypothetical protein N2689_14830 [Verrucomicrobiae bacterium]|nr:hypothetical protein [Verrucomicrobiae bacterium]